MSWTEWGVLVMGLVLGYAVVTMLMSERKVRRPKQADDAMGGAASASGSSPSPSSPTAASTPPPNPPPNPPPAP